jgi:soluble lytic murein transglycosylase-like protein
MAKFTEIAEINLNTFNVVYNVNGYNFGSEQEQARNLQYIKNIRKDYGASILKWGNEFEISEPLLVCFMAVESKGFPEGKNSSGAIGLMQVKLITVREAVSKFKTITGQNLPNLVTESLKIKAPYLLKLTPNSQKLSTANENSLEKLLIADKDFNILVGSMYLRFCLEFTKASGKAYTNKACVAYNEGLYGNISKFKGKAISTMNLAKSVSAEAKGYLAKLFGRFGYLDIYFRKI